MIEVMEKFKGLIQRAESTHSDALVIRHLNQQIILERFNQPKKLIHTMSITKSIVSLAVGKLFSMGLINIDEPVCTFYPEWKQGQKKHITLRHIMTHTSGLQNVPVTTDEIYPSPDFVQLALCAELTSLPGQTFSYNNKAVNLLAGIIEKVSTRKLDRFMDKEIFQPLDIIDFNWHRDRVGNPQVMAGLELYPEDLAKLGQLVINRGHWHGENLIDEAWFTEALQPGQPGSEIGLLWWLAPDQSYIHSNGYLGQWLVIFPEQQLVCVRMISYERVKDEVQDSFNNFTAMARDLALNL